MSHLDHKRSAPSQVGVAVVTVSDSRNEASDETGARLRGGLEAGGHRVISYALVKDEAAGIRSAVEACLGDPSVQAVILNGGTGISPRDVTPEALRPLIEKELPGFGEAFRALSFAEIGPDAMLSRAFAGTAGGKVVFALPGSTAGAFLALERLILPELGHFVAMVSPHRT